jgi:hypothetical protein
LPPGLILPLALVVIMLVLSSFADFRVVGERQLEEAGNRAIAAFAVARGINGVISVLQEVQFGVSVVVHTAFEPGQILDPLNDLIERFSNAALIAAIVLWSLRLFGEFIVLPWMPLALLILLVLRLRLERCGGCVEINQLLLRLVRVGIVLWSFAVLTPLVIDQLHHSDIVQGHYDRATQELEAAGRQLSNLGDAESLWKVDENRIRASLAELRTMADRVSEQAIIVLAVFVFEVVLVPLVIFWITSRMLLNPRTH